jgi:hypothetical protein
MAAIVLLVGSLATVHAVQVPAKDVEFLYTDKTEIVGNPVEQGIAGTIGTRVKVDYTEKSGIKTASKILVIPREAAL